MKFISMQNDGFLSIDDGNAMTIQQRIAEILRLNVFPQIIQFDSIEDIREFCSAVNMK